ncbi:MAG: EVE domain-containing protein [Rhizobiaceae bacterium]
MRAWIFQSKPDRYDLRTKLIPGKKATWYVTRYRNDINTQDDVYFWLAGDAGIRGIYGKGVIIGLPYLRPDWNDYGIDVEYTERYEPHISVNIIESNSILRNLLIVRAPFGTNFPLDHEQARAIASLARSRAA